MGIRGGRHDLPDEIGQMRRLASAFNSLALHECPNLTWEKLRGAVYSCSPTLYVALRSEELGPERLPEA